METILLYLVGQPIRISRIPRREPQEEFAIMGKNFPVMSFSAARAGVKRPIPISAKLRKNMKNAYVGRSGTVFANLLGRMRRKAATIETMGRENRRPG